MGFKEGFRKVTETLINVFVFEISTEFSSKKQEATEMFLPRKTKQLTLRRYLFIYVIKIGIAF